MGVFQALIAMMLLVTALSGNVAEETNATDDATTTVEE